MLKALTNAQDPKSIFSLSKRAYSIEHWPIINCDFDPKWCHKCSRPPRPPTVLARNLLFLSKFLRFWSNFKEHLNEYLIMLEILPQIFDISSKIGSYNVLDFDPNYMLVMFKNLTQIFDISTKIEDILNKIFKNLKKVFEIS